MSFFDDAPVAPPPPERSYRTPEWVGPAANVLPATVALDAVLVRRDDLVVWVAGARAHPTGVELTVSVLRRDADRHHDAPFFGPATTGKVRFGVAFADGRRAVLAPPAGPLLDAPATPVLRPRGGSASGGAAHADLWLWPLPPAGPLTFVLAWPDEGVEEARVEVDGAALSAAAERAVELWPDDRPLPPSEGEVLV